MTDRLFSESGKFQRIPAEDRRVQFSWNDDWVHHWDLGPYLQESVEADIRSSCPPGKIPREVRVVIADNAATVVDVEAVAIGATVMDCM